MSHFEDSKVSGLPPRDVKLSMMLVFKVEMPVVYIYIYMNIHTYIHTHIHPCMHVCMHAYIIHIYI